VAHAVDGLSAAWESHLQGDGPEPVIQRFLPADDEALRRLVATELVKLDLEYRWQYRRDARRLEDYARVLPELGPADALSLELIHEELQVRMQCGDRVSEQEIRQRFPAQADRLCELVGGMAVTGSPTCTYYAETVKSGEQGGGE